MATDKPVATVDLDAKLEELMALAPEQRLWLGERLLESVPFFATPEIETYWNEEIARRIDDIESGRVQPIPAEQVFAAIEAKLQAKREDRQVP